MACFGAHTVSELSAYTVYSKQFMASKTCMSFSWDSQASFASLLMKRVETVYVEPNKSLFRPIPRSLLIASTCLK